MGLIAMLCFVIGALPTPCQAQERITLFSSDITVNEDATMTVQETIKVVSENVNIQHGIYRDFPTTYRDRYDNRVVVAFRVESVTRDGDAEAYHTKSMPNGVRVYMGSADTLVSPGVHTYVFTYSTDRQVGFFDDHDELYWNVTGVGWEFPIERAEARVTLPQGIPASAIKLDGWTGVQDSTAKNMAASLDTYGKPVFRTTSPLGLHEGLTIAVWWPKGFVSPPTRLQLISYFLHDNRGALVCILGLIATIGYFLWAQMKVGIDPDKGAIVPQWDPPEDMSPAALRYIRRMGTDNKGLTASLINAAVKGAIRINEAKKVYTIERAGDPKTPLAREEQAVVDALLHGGDETVLRQSNNRTIRTAIDKFTRSLQKQFDKGYFSTHVGYAAIGTLISALTLLGAVLLDTNGAVIPFVVTAALLLIANIIFYRLLRAFTKKGRALMDRAEGLRLYMSIAEEERLNVLNPPDRTPELYEKLLPYALALGVEHQWSDQFSDVLAKAQAEGYEPSWYVGRGFIAGNYGSFASSVGNSFASAISSSATPPGSSGGGGGGFSGGGSSGGGGGGGGGGGW